MLINNKSPMKSLTSSGSCFNLLIFERQYKITLAVHLLCEWLQSDNWGGLWHRFL
jgi:hypothetical protein